MYVFKCSVVYKINHRFIFLHCIIFDLLQVNGLRFIRITKGQVLIIWSDHCVNSK